MTTSLTGELPEALRRRKLPWRVTHGIASVRGKFENRDYLILVREELARTGWSWTLQCDGKIVDISREPLSRAVDAVDAAEAAYAHDLRARRRNPLPPSS